MKTIHQLLTTKALPFDQLIGNTPDKHGQSPGRKVLLQDTLELALKQSTFKCYLREVPLNKRGYDRGGSYWGLSSSDPEMRLWVVHAGFMTKQLKDLGYGVNENMPGREGETFYVDFFRGRNRAEVIDQVKKLFPFAEFSRKNG